MMLEGEEERRQIETMLRHDSRNSIGNSNSLNVIHDDISVNCIFWFRNFDVPLLDDGTLSRPHKLKWNRLLDLLSIHDLPDVFKVYEPKNACWWLSMSFSSTEYIHNEPYVRWNSNWLWKMSINSWNIVMSVMTRKKYFLLVSLMKWKSPSWSNQQTCCEMYFEKLIELTSLHEKDRKVLDSQSSTFGPF